MPRGRDWRRRSHSRLQIQAGRRDSEAVEHAALRGAVDGRNRVPSSPEARWKRVGIHVVADDDLLQAREIAFELGGLEVEEGPVTTLALWQECKNAELPTNFHAYFFTFSLGGLRPPRPPY